MYLIGVMPGDGTGPEIIDQTLRFLQALSVKHSFNYQLKRYPFGAGYYFETGTFISSDDVDELRNLDGILMGIIGDARVDSGILEQGLLHRLWNDLNLSLNVQCVKSYRSDLCPIKIKHGEAVDFVIVRENIEAASSDFGSAIKKNTPDEIAILQSVFTRSSVEKAVRFAFEVARERPRHQLTMISRQYMSTALELWQRVFGEVQVDFPDVTTNIINADTAAGLIVTRPEWFDVVVTPNRTGELLGSVGLQLQGGLGFGASSFLNPGQTSLFMSAHGSEFRAGGSGAYNPIGACVALMRLLSTIGEEEAARDGEKAIENMLKKCDLAYFKPGYINASNIIDALLDEL